LLHSWPLVLSSYSHIFFAFCVSSHLCSSLFLFLHFFALSCLRFFVRLSSSFYTSSSFVISSIVFWLLFLFPPYVFSNFFFSFIVIETFFRLCLRKRIPQHRQFGCPRPCRQIYFNKKWNYRQTLYTKISVHIGFIWFYVLDEMSTTSSWNVKFFTQKYQSIL
jgi:hypothetical protein